MRLLMSCCLLAVLGGCASRSDQSEAMSHDKLIGYTADEIRLIVASSTKFAQGLRNGGELSLNEIASELALRDRLVKAGEIAVVYLTVDQLNSPWAEKLYDQAADIYGGTTVTLINTGVIKGESVKLYIPAELESEFMLHMTK